MPISPNTGHARGRDPLRTQPPFPFPNCYFWIESRMQLRVQAIPGGFDRHAKPGIELTVGSHVDLRAAFTQDLPRMRDQADAYIGQYMNCL